MKKFGTILTVLILLVILSGIGFVAYGYYRKQTMEVKNPVVTMEVENFGTVKMELYPDLAPNTVANFVKLTNRGFYDGLTFHRIIKDFMIQGGDKKGDGTGSASLSDLKDGGEDKDYSIKGEFIANHVKNTLKFEEGVLAMGRSDYSSISSQLLDESYNSASSQFFIMTGENTNLNGYYTGFGKVIEGMDVVKKISEVEVTANTTGSEDAEATTETSENTEVSKPVNPPKITSMKVDTFGVDYGDPETLDSFDYMSWIYKQYGLDSSTLGQ